MTLLQYMDIVRLVIINIYLNKTVEIALQRSTPLYNYDDYYDNNNNSSTL